MIKYLLSNTIPIDNNCNYIPIRNDIFCENNILNRIRCIIGNIIFDL